MTPIFFVLALLALVSAIGMVAFKNPIHSALSLVGNLLAVAGFYALLDAHFLAAVQVIVYAGAIMVLVLFMLMLLNIKVEERTARENVYTILAIVVGVAFLAAVVPYVHEAFQTLPRAADQQVPLEGTVEAIGIELYTRYVFLFQAAGAILMAAIVGAVILAKRNFREAK